MTSPCLLAPHGLALETVLQNRYRIQQLLRQTSASRLYLADDLTAAGTQVELQEFTPRNPGVYILERCLEAFEETLADLHALDHPQILCPTQVFAEAERLFLVQAHTEAEPLLNLLSEARSGSWRDRLSEQLALGETRLHLPPHLSEPEVVGLMRDILELLLPLHQQGVIHRNLTPTSILLRNRDYLPLLTDFGAFSEALRHLQSSVLDDANGSLTPGYAPIDQVQTGRAFCHSDLYAVGVIALHLLTGQPPEQLFQRTPLLTPLPTTLNMSWQQSLALDAYRDRISPSLLRLLELLLAPQPGDRFASALNVLSALDQLDLSEPQSPPPVLVELPLPNASEVTYDLPSSQVASEIADDLPLPDFSDELEADLLPDLYQVSAIGAASEEPDALAAFSDGPPPEALTADDPTLPLEQVVDEFLQQLERNNPRKASPPAPPLPPGLLSNDSQQQQPADVVEALLAQLDRTASRKASPPTSPGISQGWQPPLGDTRSGGSAPSPQSLDLDPAPLVIPDTWPQGTSQMGDEDTQPGESMTSAEDFFDAIRSRSVDVEAVSFPEAYVPALTLSTDLDSPAVLNPARPRFSGDLVTSVGAAALLLGGACVWSYMIMADQRQTPGDSSRTVANNPDPATASGAQQPTNAAAPESSPPEPSAAANRPDPARSNSTLTNAASEPADLSRSISSLRQTLQGQQPATSASAPKPVSAPAPASTVRPGVAISSVPNPLPTSLGSGAAAPPARRPSSASARPAPVQSASARPSSASSSPAARATVAARPQAAPQTTAQTVPSPRLDSSDVSTASTASAASASSRLLTSADLEGRSADELNQLRNEIYARRGRQFVDPKLRRYFESKSWYRPRFSPGEFPVSSLSPTELRNAILIRDYQRAKGLL